MTGGRPEPESGGVEARGFGRRDAWRAAVTVPARNEAERIASCLSAIRESLADRGGIVVAVNGSHDATHRLALDWFETSGAPGIVLNDPAPPPGSGVGRARDLALKAALARLAPDGALMTTDADARVDPGWVAANLAELAGADLVCGLVEPDPAEFAALPEAVARRGAVEGEYIHLLRTLREMLDPAPRPVAPAHDNAAGASLAFTPALYRDLGAMPDVTEREDRLFVEQAARRGWTVSYAMSPRVYASCRLDGRTPGGMAGALRSRIHDPDPYCDETLEPVEAAIARLRDPAAPAGPSHAAAPPGARMRLSEVAAELPRLQRLVADLAARSVAR